MEWYTITMENPYKLRRLSDSYTQRSLALILNVTPQSVLMVEQGLFESPPEFIRSRYPGLETQYQIWREQSRHEVDLSDRETGGSWYDFRGESFKGFCVLIKFQPSILRDFEKHYYSRPLLVSALVQCNVEPPVALSVTERQKVRPSYQWSSQTTMNQHQVTSG